jgi:hypothetical protein
MEYFTARDPIAVDPCGSWMKATESTTVANRKPLGVLKNFERIEFVERSTDRASGFAPGGRPAKSVRPDEGDLG